MANVIGLGLALIIFNVSSLLGDLYPHLGYVQFISTGFEILSFLLGFASIMEFYKEGSHRLETLNASKLTKIASGTGLFVLSLAALSLFSLQIPVQESWLSAEAKKFQNERYAKISLEAEKHLQMWKDKAKGKVALEPLYSLSPLLETYQKIQWPVAGVVGETKIKTVAINFLYENIEECEKNKEYFSWLTEKELKCQLN